MAIVKVQKTGVYRHKGGHAIFLREGEETHDRILADYKHDKAATDARENRPERVYLGTIRDDPGARAIAGAPENKAMNQPAEQKSDAELAASKAKK